MNELLNSISTSEIANALKVLTQLGSSIVNQNRDVIVKEGCDYYKSYAKSNLSYKSQLSIGTTLKHFQNYFSPVRPISTITPHDAEKFIDHIKKNAPRGYAVYLRTIKAMYNKFIDWNFISVSPFQKIKIVKVQSGAPKYLKKEEFEKVMEKIEKEVVRDFCYVAYGTGARLQELTTLRWVNIDLTKKTIKIGDPDNFTTKNRKQRIIPMNEIVFKILSKRYAEQNSSSKGTTKYLFGKSKTQHYTGDYFSKMFKKACRAASLDESIHMHSLRHTAASLMVQEGASLIDVQHILGHSSLSMVLQYAHTDLSNLRKAIDKLN